MKKTIKSSSPNAPLNPQPPPGQAEAKETNKLQEQSESSFPAFEEHLKNHRNVARALKAHMEPHYRRIPAIACGPTPETDQARFERIFQPWPKWVFRLGSELWHADYPTIDRDIFFQTFRVVNVFLFRFPTSPKAKDVAKWCLWERIDLRVVPLMVASFMGHAVEHLEAFRKKIDEELATGKISPEQHSVALKQASLEQFDNLLRESFATWSKSDEVGPFELTRAVESARRKTVEQQKNPPKAALIPAYRTMLSNWITIEKMSGPKELTHLLMPVLGDKDFYVANVRVRQICSRLGVKFKPPSRETK